MKRTILKTAGQLIEFLQQFPPETKVCIAARDCFNDEPYTREFTVYPGIKKNRKHTVISF